MTTEKVYDSYVIGYDVIHLHWWRKASSVKMAWKGQEMTPSQKKLSYLYWVIEESKDELQKTLDKPGNSHAVSSRNDFIAGLDWKHTTKLQENEHMCKPRGDLIILRTGKLINRSQPSAERAGGPDPPGKSQVIWVSIGNKQLDPSPPPPPPPPPPGKNLDHLRNLEKCYFSLKLIIWLL